MVCKTAVHDDDSVPRPDWRKRLFARFMAACSPKGDHRFHDRKEKLFSSISKEKGVADVAEIGMGTAPNLKYYGSRVDSIVGLDFNAAMQPYALESAAKAGLDADKLQLVVGRAEALPLPDACVDAVIATHAMHEILRVLRPGGKYIFLEHVAAPQRTRLHSVQHWLDPLCIALADGCHMTRDTLKTIEAAGFRRVEAERFDAEVPWPAAMFAPHVAGMAIK